MEPAVKGYMVQCAGRCVLNDPLLSSKVPRALLDEVTRHQTALKPTAWVDRKIFVEVLRAVAAAHDGDDQAAYRALVGCGKASAAFATGTFLRLLLKLVTPKLFAGKLPDLWARDHRSSGRLHVESIDDHSMDVRVRDVDGYDHFGPVGLGFISSGLASTGAKNLDIRLVSPWSIERPGAAEVHLIATWQ